MSDEHKNGSSTVVSSGCLFFGASTSRILSWDSGETWLMEAARPLGVSSELVLLTLVRKLHAVIDSVVVQRCQCIPA